MKDKKHERSRGVALLLFVVLALCVGTAGGVLWFSRSSQVAEQRRDKPHDEDDGLHDRREETGSVISDRARVSPTAQAAQPANSTHRPSSGANAVPAGVRRVPELSLAPGLCPDRDAAWQRSRAQYLATFVDVNVAAQQTYNARLLVAPGTLPRVLLRVGWALHSLGTSIQDRLDLPIEAGTIYLYPSEEALREHACVHPSATAYYDGAIHLAPPDLDSPEWDRWPSNAIRHEYTHHVLMTACVGEPFWFQEGVAMQIAHDNPRAQDYPVEAFAVEEMTGALDHSDTETNVLQRYAQSFLMVGFLQATCHRIPLSEQAMARALLDRVVAPGNLFHWAAHQCTQDLDEPAASLWAVYSQTRRLDDTILRRVSQRTPPESAR